MFNTQATELVFTEEQITEAIHSTASKLNCALHKEQKPIIVLGVLPSSIYYLTDLTRLFTFNFELEFISYEKREDGTLKLTSLPRKNLRDAYVIVIDNVSASGTTLNAVKDHLLHRGCQDMCFTTLVTKTQDSLRDTSPNYFDCLIYNGEEELIGNRLGHTNDVRRCQKGIHVKLAIED